MLKEKYNSKFFRDNFPALRKSMYLNTGSEGLIPRESYNRISKYLKKVFKYGAAHPELFNYIMKENKKLGLEIKELNLNVEKLIKVTSTSEGLNYAFNMYDFSRGDKILLLKGEFKTGVLAAIALCHRTQAEILWAEDINDYLKKLEKETVKAALISHVDYSNGKIFDIEKIYNICLKKDIYFIVDAAQSFGNIFWKFPDNIPADMYIWTTHKWSCAPRGLGYIIPSKRILSRIKPLTYSYFSTTEYNPPAKISFNENPEVYSNHFGNFVSELGFLTSIKWIRKRIGFNMADELRNKMKKYFLENIKKLPVKMVDSDSFLISFTHSKNISNEEIIQKLARENVTIRFIPNTDFLRISIHFYNTKREIDSLVKKLAKYFC
ncbi:MAG: aminotransferase class V-fold PLP-dependent enzyme [Candidatus Muiribacteriota bacterium]